MGQILRDIGIWTDIVYMSYIMINEKGKGGVIDWNTVHYWNIQSRHRRIPLFIRVYAASVEY